MTFPFLFRRGWFALLIVGICLAEKAQAADPLSADVVIVANADDPDSVSLAHFYAQKRQIPEKNIILLYATGDETVTWHAFVELIWRPLQEELFKRGWLRGIPSFLYDHYGRKKYGITGHHISYLVVCKGLPLRISEDPSLIDPTDMEKIRPEMRITCAAVDSELSLLAQNNTSPVGYIGNPLYQRKTPTAAESERVVKVARLDGPSYVAARGLINSALAAEKNGLDGRYYIDEGGPHPEGNAWLASVRAQLEQLGFDGDTESTTGTIQQTARFDAPVLYFGWYAPDLTGPMVLPGFHFPSGAIALHIHSYSAVTLRSDQKGWCGPLVARGVTATFGNV
ncbi:MAG TPA: TIGR03790 family protein, partial [Opitutaceae bacterium]|nr:TIGR03790 family protein [Opitutaceae bacterium]